VVSPIDLAAAARGDNPAPKDLESQLRCAAVAAATAAQVELNDDLADTLAAIACETLEEVHSSDRSSALEQAFGPVFEEAGFTGPERAAVLESVLTAYNEDSGNNSSTQLSPSICTAVLLAPTRKKPRLASVCVRLPSGEQTAAIPLPSEEGGTGDVASVKAAPRVYARRRDVENSRALAYLAERSEEVNRLRAQELLREQAIKEYLGIAAQDAARDAVLESANDRATAAVGEDDDSDSESSEDDEAARVDREELKCRLRELGYPVTLFGEGDAGRVLRLRKLELAREQDVYATGSTNIMQLVDKIASRMGEDAAYQVEEDAEELAEETRRKTAAAVAASKGSGDIVASARAAGGAASFSKEQGKAGGAAVSKSTSGKSVDVDDDSDIDEGVKDDEFADVVARWLRNSLREWETAIRERGALGDHDRAAEAELKREKGSYRQSKQYLRPLRQALRDGSVHPGIVKQLGGIAQKAEARDYTLAKEAYMKLAIGSNPWPIGVTFVTFHDRANRHKIGEEACAHILNDETTRKYIQTVKRLLTFCETRWPQAS